jgi:hypothetical protein
VANSVMRAYLESAARSRAAGEYRYCVRPRWSTPVAWTDALASGDAHTSTHAGGIASRCSRPRTAGSSTDSPASSTHVSGRAVMRWSPGGRNVRGVGSVPPLERVTAPECPIGYRPPPRLSAFRRWEGSAPDGDRLAMGISDVLDDLTLGRVEHPAEFSCYDPGAARPVDAG